jgi:hypothetical protein
VNAARKLHPSAGARRRSEGTAKADARNAATARRIAELVESGDAVIVGTSADGLEQWGLTPAGTARMRADLEADGVNPEDSAAITLWIAGLFA